MQSQQQLSPVGLAEAEQESAATAADLEGPAAREALQPELSYEQNVEGIKRAFRDFLRTEAGLLYLDRVLSAPDNLPCVRVSFPTGSKDLDGGQIAVEVDLLDLVRKLAKSPDDADELARSLLGPIRSYLWLLYTRSLSQLAQHAGGARQGLVETSPSSRKPAGEAGA